LYNIRTLEKFLKPYCSRIKMKVLVSVILVQYLLVPGHLVSFSSEEFQSFSGAVFEFNYRALEPGEVIMLSLKNSSSIDNVTVKFLDREYSLGKVGSEWKSFILIGLDMALKPASYNMKMFIRKADNEWEFFQKKIVVSRKEFPIKKLWVKEKFVTPPPEVHERISREAELLRIIYSVATPRWLGEGRFIFPVEGKVNPNFGERRIFNNKPRSPHSGLDVSSPQGTPVIASNSGEVVLARNLYFSGNTVIINHGYGLFTLYCHFSKIDVKRGNFVNKGDIIGRVGATGRVTGPHLHWGVRLLGTRIDPLSLLSLPLNNKNNQQ